MQNVSKPSTTLSNSDKVSFAETWGAIPTTWAAETRTWAECISLFDNSSKPTTTITNVNKP